MDYFVELAHVPDLLEAVQRVRDREPRSAKEADDLLQSEFLREEHPSAWIAEVVRAFYRTPALAARVWVNLRYCESFRQRLAEYTLGTESAWSWKTKQPVPVIQKYIDQFRTDPRAAVKAFAALIREDRHVEKLMGESALLPEPPGFLRVLLEAAKTAPADIDAATQDLLAHPDKTRALAKSHKVAVPFDLVLHEELDQIDATRRRVHRVQRPTHADPSVGASLADSGQDAPIRRALDMDLLGLAFSGGGIRSATFNLGVLQALSKIGLLRQCDYLSTVSGGGYIGSWLAAWIRRESIAAGSGSNTMVDIQRRLSPVRSPDPTDERVRPIRFLREYSNYLTPRTGFFSADTWTMIGIYVRNALLNQVIIVALFGAALLVPRLIVGLTHIGRIHASVPWILWGLGAAVLVANLIQLRPPHSTAAMAPRLATPSMKALIERILAFVATQAAIQIGVVLPWVLAAAMTTSYFSQPWPFLREPLPQREMTLSVAAGIVIAASLFVILLLGRVDRCWTRRWSAVGAIALAASVCGVVAAGLTWVVVRTLSMADSESQQWHAIGLGTAGLLSVLSLSMVAMLGMLGEKFPDEHREWWSKLRTFVHVWAIGWVAAFVAAVYVPWGFRWLQDSGLGGNVGVSATIAWVASTWFGVSKGRTAEDDKKQEHERGGEDVPLSAGVVSTAAHIAPYVFIVGLVFGISIAIDQIFGANVPDQSSHLNRVQHYWPFATWISTGWPAPIAALGLTVVGLLFSWRVDINDFSLHHFYKNRLVRCYLGASHTAERQADWFTGFDPSDDLRLKSFDHHEPGVPEYPGPYPILNCALNLVGGQDLAWQERKSTSFVFTPKFCGYDVDRAVISAGRQGLRDDGYVPTDNYYHPNRGPGLGMAMAISGAAASPNMGRASSPALAFLMTVFNVRLGWWVGNPRKRDGVTRPSPRLGLPYTALELFGGTDDRKRYVNLSDGGHFENLGVYELVRRGCRYIIVCDAGQDERFVGEDLANLVRQCRTDFGVEIDIDIHRICGRKENRLSEAHCVVGRIHYLQIPRRTMFGRLMSEEEGPLLRGSRPAHEEGYLIYLKPSLTGDEPQDLVEYSRRVPQFPHQTTADQWFDESQFESYRKLGMHVGEETFSRYQDDDTRPLANLGQLFERLRGHWYPPSQAIHANSTYHVNEYTRIMELIRTKPELRHLDHTMFEQWPESGAVDPREEFYICNAMIQLIENVYADLDLEDLWDHPHVQGWMSVFWRWAKQPAFRRTWQKSEATYAERFRNFYNDRLRGRPIALPRSFVASRGRVDLGVNTLDAFTRALRQGASVVALDVCRLRDGAVVVWPRTPIDLKRLETLTLPQLRAQSPHVVLLADCAKQLQGRVHLAVTLMMEGIEADVLRVLRDPAAKWRRHDFVLTSTDESMIEAVHKLDSSVRTGLLVGTRAAFDDALKRFVELRTDFLGPEESLLAQEDLDGATAQRVPLVPWTVNDRSRLELLLKQDIVAGVITDDVALALDVKRHI
jgi:glycerophosphoryl diester phosphodiesterase